MPIVSIIMPVYNAATYLEEALGSMLKQTYTDFECIVINDGSTDNSDAIIRSFRDPRLRYLQNDGNKGLVFTLNRGIAEARGQYIARMDSDDVSLPERLQEQVSYLDAHPEVDLVACVVRLVDAQGHPVGYWKEDREIVSPEAIRNTLPMTNCLAHPSVMVRTEVMKAFGYRQDQSQAEDYDLWLRMLSQGKQLHKIDKPLLLYRVLPSSLTRKHQKNVFFYQAETKLRFALEALRHGQRNSVVVRAGLSSFTDYGKGYLKEMKHWITPE